MKYAVIIDSYPSSDDDKNLLLKNLKILKSQNIDVILTSHHPCNSEIIENSTYFLYESENNYYYLDSNIINENISGITNPIYQKYIELGGYIFYDRCVITGWSVAIISQMINSIKFLWSKGYDYAFYIVEDCIIPNNFKEILDKILTKQSIYRNYFIENPNIQPWLAGYFFGFTIDNYLISKFPKVDLSQNKIYQKYFPNCSAEDFMLRIWGNENNQISEYNTLDRIFGQNNWNTKSSTIQTGSSHLHYTTISSLFVDISLQQTILLLFVNNECYSNEIEFNIKISDENKNDIFIRNIILQKNSWFMIDLDCIFSNKETIMLEKKIGCTTDKTYYFEDNIIINSTYIDRYSLIKNFVKI